jgi:uncharacterized protein YqeY
MSRKEVSTYTGLRNQILHVCKAQQSNPTCDELNQLTLRLIQCAIIDRDMCVRSRCIGDECSDDDVRCVLETLIQQFENSARENDKTGRIQDAIRMRNKVDIIQQFLPKPLCGEKLNMAVKQIIEDLGACKLADLGRCVIELRQRYPNQIESNSAVKLLRTALNNPNG